MSLREHITDCLNNWDVRGDDENHFPTIYDLYPKSKIDIDEFYRNCLIISYKTSNSQLECENMAYWKFNNLLVFLDEVLTQEAGEQPADAENQQGTKFQQQAKIQQRQAMNNAKSMMGKAPKIPKMPR